MNKQRETRKKELMEELNKIKAEEEKEEDERRFQKAKSYIANIDSILALVPDHSRTSCSDDNTINSYDCRCKRCFLLEVKQSLFWDEDYEVQIEIVKTRNSMEK